MVYCWCMALNIKNTEVESLAAEVARMAKESKTEAIRKALEERKLRLSVRSTPEAKAEQLVKFFETAIWPRIPKNVRGKRITKREREELLGYGPRGYSE
jgi:antitoxin VapB